MLDDMDMDDSQRHPMNMSVDRSQKPLSMRDSFLSSMFENGGRQMLFRHVFQLLTRPFVDLFKF